MIYSRGAAILVVALATFIRIFVQVKSKQTEYLIEVSFK